MPIPTVAARTLRVLALVAVSLTTLEICARIQDRVTSNIPPLALRYTAPALYAYDGAGPHGIPHAINGKYHMNSLGFRGPEPVAGRTTVVTLGASETYGVYESPDNEFPRQLERLLNGPVTPRFQVINAALPGERVAALAATLPETLRKVHPAIAVLYLTPGSAIWTEARWHELHPTPHDNDPPAETTGRSRLVQHVREVVDSIMPASVRAWQLRRSVIHAAAVTNAVPTSHLPDTNYREFSRRLETVLDLLAAAHVKAIIVTHATRFGPSGRYRDEQLDVFRSFYPELTAAGLFDEERRFDGLLRATARRHGLPLVDVAREVAPGPGNFADFFHFTDAGSAAVAKLIAPAVRSEAGS